MKKYAVVITDPDRVYLPIVSVFDSQDEAREWMRKAWEKEIDSDTDVSEGDTYFEDDFAVVTKWFGVTYFDLVRCVL